MAIPDFQSIMRPLLAVLADGQDKSVKTIRDTLAQQFGLTEEELEERLPSGRDRTYRNRVGWALTHLKGALVIESPRRGVYRITERGRRVLTETPETERVDLRTLSAFEEYRRFRSQESSGDDGASAGTAGTTPDATSAGTPTERIEAASRELRAALAVDVLDRVREQSPEFFEQVVLDVLQAMGYGGSRENSAERLGRSGDGGVDGVIREDKLGLDLIYVQAKRWTNTVGRPDIQQFVGALNGQRAHKGVFIATSTFSREAIEYADAVNPRVILVDGRQLAELMIDHDVGVSIETIYRIRRVDLDYFGVEDARSPARSSCRDQQPLGLPGCCAPRATRLPAMVRTGARAAVLLDALMATGLEPLAARAAPPRPHAADLPQAIYAELLELYRSLGGSQDTPTFRPGGWDLPFNGPLVVELDEELHFNRYRASTLDSSWEAGLPWTFDYRRHCADHESACLRAGSWGRRWSNDSTSHMFSGGRPGDLTCGGSPRWKQRALYDSLKDTAPLLGGPRLARVATHDIVNGVLVGSMLDGVAPVDAVGIRCLVDSRTT